MKKPSGTSKRGILSHDTEFEQQNHLFGVV
jgi:hypothetical protein